jgi:hypothetical protein
MPPTPRHPSTAVCFEKKGASVGASVFCRFSRFLAFLAGRWLLSYITPNFVAPGWWRLGCERIVNVLQR